MAGFKPTEFDLHRIVTDRCNIRGSIWRRRVWNRTKQNMITQHLKPKKEQNYYGEDLLQCPAQVLPLLWKLCAGLMQSKARSKGQGWELVGNKDGKSWGSLPSWQWPLQWVQPHCQGGLLAALFVEDNAPFLSSPSPSWPREPRFLILRMGAEEGEQDGDCVGRTPRWELGSWKQTSATTWTWPQDWLVREQWWSR